MGILENIVSVRRRITEAAERAGRSPDGIGLVAVTKYASIPSIEEALQTGDLDWIGESRVQDGVAKHEQFKGLLTKLGVGIRMIGHLQRNKIPKAVDCFETIDSIDSLKTARALDQRLEQTGRKIRVLVQLNLGNLGQRGVSPDELGAFLGSLRPLDHLEIEGLMAIGPHQSDAALIRGAFRKARELFEQFFMKSSEEGLNPKNPVLSLGMSADFELAVEEGATLVRVGSAIFPESEKLSRTREAA